MSVKTLDQQGRWRGVTVAFRMSAEENELLNRLVNLSGLTKQDYIIRRLLDKEVIVQGNPRVYKALRNQLAAVLNELRQLNSTSDGSDDLVTVIQMIAAILGDMKEEYHG